MTSPGLALSALMRTLQLASPALPVGAYAYSHGLEQAVARGWVHDEESARVWIQGVLEHAIGGLDLPVLARLHRGYARGEPTEVQEWDGFLRASRETAELALEDRQIGMALARVLVDLAVPGAEGLRASGASHARAFALACTHWGIGLSECLSAFAFAFAEGQVSAAVKLVPLGQRAGQAILSKTIALIERVVGEAELCADEDVGSLAVGLAMASTLHETQHVRLFRS